MSSVKKIKTRTSKTDFFHNTFYISNLRRFINLSLFSKTDPTIDRSEKNKPVQSVFERFVQLQACKYVDEVVVYETEKDLLDILKSYPINVRILGKEYEDKNFTGKDLNYIEVHYNERKHSFSTTELRKRVINKYLEENQIK